MALPVTFAALTAATGAQLDQNYAAVGALTIIPCTITGTNTLVLTPLANTPAVSAYANYNVFSGIIAVTNTTAVTVNVNSIGAKSGYKDSSTGPAALAANNLYAGNYALFIYDSALNSNAGGFHIKTGVV